jgi:hypothetical protein
LVQWHFRCSSDWGVIPALRYRFFYEFIFHFITHDKIASYKFKGDFGMNDRRKYQRYYINDDGDLPAQFEVRVSGSLVSLVDFSLSGLSVLSKKAFSPGVISVLIKFGNRGILDLTGNVVRVKEEGDMWRIAIDLSETYKLNPA